MVANESMDHLMQTVEAVFEGEVLIPDTPLDLQEGTRVRITVEQIEKSEINEFPSFLKTAQSLKLEGPSNWSEQINDALTSDSHFR